MFYLVIVKKSILKLISFQAHDSFYLTSTTKTYCQLKLSAHALI